MENCIKLIFNPTFLYLGRRYNTPNLMCINVFCVKKVYSSERTEEYKMNKNIKSIL